MPGGIYSSMGRGGRRRTPAVSEPQQAATPTLGSECKRGAVFGALAGIVVAAVGMGGYLTYATALAVLGSRLSNVPHLLSGGMTMLLIGLPAVAIIGAFVGAVVTTMFAFLGRHI